MGERGSKCPKSLVGCMDGCVRVCVCAIEYGCKCAYADAPAWDAPPPFIAQGVRVYREGGRVCVGVGRLLTPFRY